VKIRPEQKDKRTNLPLLISNSTNKKSMLIESIFNFNKRKEANINKLNVNNKKILLAFIIFVILQDSLLVLIYLLHTGEQNDQQLYGPPEFSQLNCLALRN